MNTIRRHFLGGRETIVCKGFHGHVGQVQGEGDALSCGPALGGGVGGGGDVVHVGLHLERHGAGLVLREVLHTVIRQQSKSSNSLLAGGFDAINNSYNAHQDGGVIGVQPLLP